MQELLLSFIVIFLAITIIPTLARRLRIPVIVLELLLGVLIGSTFLDILPEHSIIEFFSSFGLVYLLFLVGLEVDLNRVLKDLKESVVIAVISLVLPFVAGLFISKFVDIHPLLIGTILSTSSVGVVLPLLKEMKNNERFNKVVLSSVILVEAISIFLLSFSLAFIQGDVLSTLAAMAMAILMLILLPWGIKRFRVKQWIDKKVEDQTFFNTEVRFAFALILILGAAASQLGFEGILGAFLAGLILSALEQSKRLHEKLDSFGYGFFIPLFFVFTGAHIDVTALVTDLHMLVTLGVLIAAAILSNFAGVFFVARWKRFTARQSAAMALFHTTLTSLTIAAADVAGREGVIDDRQFTLFVVLALVTAIVGPIIGRYLLRKEPAKA